jgi:hypothetical protein
LDPKYVESLPVRTISTGDKKMHVKYDKTTATIYALDKDMTWNGNYTHKELDEQPPEPVTEPPLTPLSIDPDIASDSIEPNSPENTASNKSEDICINEDTILQEEDVAAEEDEEDSKKLFGIPKKLILPIAFVLIAVVLVVAIISTVMKAAKDPSQIQDPSLQTENNIPSDDLLPPEVVFGTDASESQDITEPSDMAATAPSVPDIYLLSPIAPLVPGQKIDESIFEQIGIQDEEYRRLTTATGLYTADDLEKIVGLVAVNYVPAGRYLSYDDIGRIYAPANPWDAEMADAVTVMLPVTPVPSNLQTLLWNNQVDLVIEVRTEQTNENEVLQGENDPPEGMEHQSSVVQAVVINTYTLQGVRIKDILNSNEFSLFNRYMAIAQIPSAFQVDYLSSYYAEPLHLESDLPGYISIVVTQEQADILTKLDPSQMTVTISNPATVNTTPLQNETYSELIEAVTAIADTWNSLGEENETTEE